IWVRLATWGVAAPEAYTLPVTGPALIVGLLRRRRDAAVSSWTAYGSGLAVTLVPSLLAAWDDQHWLRPLALGVAALAVTLAGARHRLQAPLVLGPGVLALVALHELTPYLAQVVGALPRWAPPAVAGLVLLVLGATYEQRLRDARRLREALGRLG
ncbi:SCO7613 C-terminal domain-containing membrane protein, partial [Streptomyces violaceoruber]